MARRARSLGSRRRYAKWLRRWRGGCARGIEQAASPPCRPGPEGGDAVRRQPSSVKAALSEPRRRPTRGENPVVEPRVLLGRSLAQLLQCVPLGQRRHVHQVAGGGTAEQRERLVGGHLVGSTRPNASCTASRMRASWATSTTTARPSPTVTVSRVNSGPRRSTRTWAPSARSAAASASARGATSAGSGVNRSRSWVGRSTRSWASIAPPPASATRPPAATRKRSGLSHLEPCGALVTTPVARHNCGHENRVAA
jgi:hypothetical protein